jgi:gamma-glutamyltranspeptidase/glutathione hydrolase
MRSVTLLVFLAACTSSGARPPSPAEAQQGEPARVQPSFADSWKYRAGQQLTVAPHGMTASSSRLAAEAGTEILRAGGNAVDAAVATGFALAVTYPEAGNLGGGGYMLIRLRNGTVAALDYREKAPLASYRDMFLDSAGVLTQEAVSGRAASGVPGSVAGLTTAHAKYGSLPLARVMAPAIRLASEGFIVDSALARSVAGKETLIKRFAGVATFFPGGRPLVKGSRFVQPELAQTLKLIAENGARGFYHGTVAAHIVAEMQRGCPRGTSDRARASRGCGLITARDLASYQPSWRTPLRTTFRGYTLLSMPPSSSGGITVGEALNILENAPAHSFGSAGGLHYFASAFQRAFMDRNALLGDPDFVKVPTERLLSKSYAARMLAEIDPSRKTPTSTLVTQMREGTETTQYSVADSSGNVVSTTTTLNSLYGSGVYVAEAGFFLNNEMDDFSTQPGTRNQFGLVQGEANAVAPGKRMLSAMSPTIVLDPSGDPYLVAGARGGPRIITSTAHVILNVIEHRMNLADAVNAPRAHFQAIPDTLRIDRGGFSEETIAGLRTLGYPLEPVDYVGGSVVAIKRVRGGWVGMDDPRGLGGGAVGY